MNICLKHFFWWYEGITSPPHNDKAILRILFISKEVLALTNTWFFAFSIHSMKFCLLQFSPFFACHFIKKLKRIKKGEKSCFFNEGCGFLFTKRKINFYHTTIKFEIKSFVYQRAGEGTTVEYFTMFLFQ